jgi:hypothetical protein
LTKELELSAQFMAALHTLDIARVRETSEYKAMFETAPSDQVDLVIEQMFEKLKLERDKNPENWADVVAEIELHAEKERTSGMMENIFVPSADAYAVTLLERRLGLPGAAVTVPFEHVSETREGYCYENVQRVVEERGGSILYGWVVWQHDDIFIEAEAHAVWQKLSGELACITPQTPAEKFLTFIPDATAIYDFHSRLITKNVRVALRSDTRLEKFFQLCDQQTDLFNAGRRRDPNNLGLAGKDADAFLTLDIQKTALMMQVLSGQPSVPIGAQPFTNVETRQVTPKVGRNDPCPCGSGKKYKKCHGA